MIEIFNDLYKKVLGFFQPQEEKENVKEVACNRLKLVLMQDRTNLTPQLLERMRGELIDLFSKYVEMDKEALELNFAQEGDSMALMLSIPVLRAKDEEEIQAILDAEDAAKETGNLEEVNEETEEVENEVSETEEEIDETDEDLTEEFNEDVCSCDLEDNEGVNEISESPDDIKEEIKEETSEKKSKKKD